MCVPTMLPRLIPLLAVMALLTACSARRAPAPVSAPVEPLADSAGSPAASAPPVDIPALIERGCYSCLQRALGDARQRDRADLIFEAAVLLALRAKELGLPHQEPLDIAAGAVQGDAGRTAVLEMVAAVPLDPLTGVRANAATLARLRPEVIGGWIDSLETAPGSAPFRSYVALALRCSARGPIEKPPEAGVADDVREIPLVRYRLGICGNAYAKELRDVAAADPEFTDVYYRLGIYALELMPYPDIDEGLRLLELAAAAFPDSPAIVMSLGDLYQGIEDWTSALRTYDAALALVPDHPEALRGRMITLSSVSEHDAAIGAATRLIDIGMYLSDAFYWRAWNHFNAERYETARADGNRMKSLRLNARVYLLSGMIDWRLRRLESAETEFEQSLVMDAGQCESATFLGGVRNERGKSPEALAAFTQAKRCYELTITVLRELIRTLHASEATEGYKVRETARHERAIAIAEKRRDEADYGIELLQKYLTSIQGRPAPPRP